jgi:hypothetical protein
MTGGLSYSYALLGFKQFVETLPPLVPPELKKEIKEMYNEMIHGGTKCVEVLEELLFHYSKLVWPYKQAFQYFFHSEEQLLAQKIFLKKCSPSLRKKYKSIMLQGVSFFDIYKGRAMHFFDHIHRVEIVGILTDIIEYLRRHVRQIVLGLHEKKYRKKINIFKEELKEMEGHVSELQKLLHDKSYKNLHFEIKAYVKGYEEGLALFHKGIKKLELANAKKHFAGRLFEQKKLRKC